MSPRARSLLFFGITVVLALVFARLGIWQLHRLAQRRAANRAALAARALRPLSLDDPGNGFGTAAGRRVSITGRYDHAAEVVIRGQSKGGVPGVRIVTPLRPLRGDTAVLVQRGYVPSPDAVTVNLTDLEEPGVLRVTGIALALPDSGVQGEPVEREGTTSWRQLDLAGLRARLPYPLAPILLLQTPDTALPRLPSRDQPPALDDGPHLSYAIQWFSFAVTAVVVGGIVGLRGMRE